MGISAQDILNLQPILDRFDRMEARLDAIEAMQSQAIEKHSSAETAVIDRELGEIKKHVPIMLDAMIAPRIAEIREEMQEETKRSVDAALDAFRTSIENKLAARVSTIEKALVDQSGIIATLSERAIESDANLQRLLSAVEKLCERTEPRSESRPFETHLNEAMKVPAEAPTRPDSGFRPRILKEEEAGTEHRRRPMSHI